MVKQRSSYSAFTPEGGLEVGGTMTLARTPAYLSLTPAGTNRRGISDRTMTIGRTREGCDVVIDYDANGKVVGIEIV